MVKKEVELRTKGAQSPRMWRKEGEKLKFTSAVDIMHGIGGGAEPGTQGQAEAAAAVATTPHADATNVLSQARPRPLKF